MTKPRPQADPRLAERFAKAKNVLGKKVGGKTPALVATSNLASQQHAKLLADLQIYLDNLGSRFIKYLQMKLSEKIVHEHPSSRGSALRSGANANWHGGKQLKVRRSRPGEYPAQESGSLKASVSWKVNKSNSKPTLTVGILKNIKKINPKTGKTQKRDPQMYGQQLEFRMNRHLIRFAWDEFWSKAFTDKHFKFKMPGKPVAMTLQVVRLHGGAYGNNEILTLKGYQDLLDAERIKAANWDEFKKDAGLGKWSTYRDILHEALDYNAEGEEVGAPGLMSGLTGSNTKMIDMAKLKKYLR